MKAICVKGMRDDPLAAEQGAAEVAEGDFERKRG
jgi:hypothetical protein